MVATLRSFLFFLFLASTCLFEMATTYPHFSLDTVPLTGSPAVLYNRTVASFKRQESGEDLEVTACGDDPAACGLPVGATKSAPVIDVAPMNPPGNLTCEPSPTGDYRDAHSSENEVGSWWFCWAFALMHKDQDFEAYRATLPITKTLWIKRNFVVKWDHYTVWAPEYGPKDDVYAFRIEWVKDCKPDHRTGLDPLKPLNDFQCQDVLHDAWKKCNNKGRGGAMTAGCFTYRVHTRF